ncbi:MAG: HWE histidine kinase domain-containing protein [Micropepsaceae bacterium]
MTGIDFGLLFDRLPSPYMVLDRELRFVAANASYLAVTMRKWEDLAGRYVFDMFPDPGENGRRLKASFDRVLETGQRDTLAYLPYAISVPDDAGGGLSYRYWTCAHTPMPGPDGKTAFIVQNTVDVTDIVRAEESAALPFGEIPEATTLIQRVQETAALKEEAAREAEEFRRLFLHAPSMIAVLTGPDHSFTFANDALTSFLGGRDLVGTRVRDSLPDIAAQSFMDWLNQVYRTGTPVSGNGVPVRIERPGHAAADHFVDFAFHPIFEREGLVKGIFVQGMDRTKDVEAEQRQRILLDELNHRVKNTLATVQSIAKQTLKDTESPAAARGAFEARILALSHAHDLLSRSSWAGADLRTILTRELRPYGSERADLDGEPVRLTPRAAVALGMVAHELATNAAKYGALSNGEGRVMAAWRLEAGKTGKTLNLDWRELGGPKVSPPSKRGFGSRLIRMSLEGELGGSTDLRFDPDGLTCNISIPIEESPSHGNA